MKKVIRLTIFNESFWDNGLIYSQNILPLKKYSEVENVKVEILAFISFLEFFRNGINILKMIRKLKRDNIKCRILPTFYIPHKLFYPKWYMLPFLFINTFFYILYFNIRDLFSKDSIYYNLRSYQISLVFVCFYFSKGKLIFDPRTDMLEELVNINVWTRISTSYKLWIWIERKILSISYKTIFISDPMKEDLLKRANIEANDEKYKVVYNLIDFNHFNKSSSNYNYLYTGSLGNWNKIETYLDFFLYVSKIDKISELYIVTGSNKSKYIDILNRSKYDSIRKKINIYQNIDYENLPDIYKKCRYGLQLMATEDSRIGVKFVEYLASGLIPIVNKNVKGACRFIEKYNTGFIINNEINEKFVNEIMNYELEIKNIRLLLDSNNSYLHYSKIFD